MALDRYNGGDYSQAGQNYAQFSPYRQRRRSGMQSALDQALGGGETNQGQFQPTIPPMYSPTPGAYSLTGEYRGGSTAPTKSTAAATGSGTTAADQLTQQSAVNQALAAPKPTTQQLWDSTTRRGGGSTAGGNIVTAGSGIGGAIAGGAIGGSWGGPIGMGIGALGGLIGSAINRKAATAPTDFRMGDAQQLVAAAYRDFLGREATPQEIQTHLTNIGGAGNGYVGEQGLKYLVEQAIANSPEAQAYAARQAASTASASPSATTTSPAPASTASSGGPMTDPEAIKARVTELFQSSKGRAPTAEELSYWVGKGTTPEEYSDHKVRVGWNPYWEDRLLTGSASSNPALAGDVGVVGYGYEDQNQGPSSGGGSSWDTSWAAGGANATTKSLIQKLMEELALSNALGLK